MPKNNIKRIIKIISFDVFDTCISRTFERPSDLFFTLGEKIAPNTLSKFEKENFAYTFMKNRIAAEKKAKLKYKRYQSCTFSDIYEAIQLPQNCTVSKSEVAELELTMEYDCSYCIKEIAEKIITGRDSGYKIIFISDMYFSKAFIMRLLNKHQLLNEADSLYISSEYQDSKKNGKLYNKVLAAENVKASEIIHTGDNFRADVLMAKIKGLRTHHFKKSKIYPYEIILDRNTHTPSECRINSISKFIRLTNPDTYSTPELKLFSNIAPALISFTLWTLKTAAENRLNRLYYLSRDGELPYKVAKIFEIYFPSIEVRFLYGSRSSWLLPSLSFTNINWINLVAPQKVNCSIKDILERLSFTPKEISVSEAILGDYDINNTQNRETTLTNFKNTLENIKFKNLLLLKVKDSRDLLIQYLQQERLLSDQSWAIVDSGWSLNSQAALNRVLKYIDPKKNTIGFYFGLANKHLPIGETGPTFSFTPRASIFSRRKHVTESCFLFSALQSCKGYSLTDNTMTPIFSNLFRSSFELRYSKNLHEFTLQYAIAAISLEIPLELFEEKKNVFIATLSRLISHPDLDIATHISHININADTRHNDIHIHPLCRQLKTSDIFNLILSIFIPTQLKPLFWLEASSVLSSPVVKQLAKALIYLDKLRHIITSKNRNSSSHS